jgi:F420-non-reducing hydrogenase small subunit
MTSKPKLSMYWASSCGGCEIALVNINEKILDVAAHLDFMFCPCLLDTKKKDIEALPDGDILVTFFNGALRTEENREMAHLMRRKSKVLISFGSCSYEGCIPALGNLSSNEQLFETVYSNSFSTVNPTNVRPLPETQVPEGTLSLPVLLDQVTTLGQEVAVDYIVPGCPPEPHQIWAVIETLLSGKPLPAQGSVLGAGRSTVCEECSRIRGNKKIKRFRRTHEFVPDREQCLLEQGLVCMGIATRDGCGGLCPKVNMPCSGCYGPTEGVHDQGAKMIAALGSIVDIDDIKNLPEEDINKQIDAVVAGIPDLAGTLYRYSLGGSFLRGRAR